LELFQQCDIWELFQQCDIFFYTHSTPRRYVVMMGPCVHPSVPLSYVEQVAVYLLTDTITSYV
jgi:hypothetical protein